MPYVRKSLSGQENPHAKKHLYTPSRKTNSGPSGMITKTFSTRPTSSNPYSNYVKRLDEMNSLQQVAHFAPDVIIKTEEFKGNQNGQSCSVFRASCTLRGIAIRAIHFTKEDAKQALASKIIKQFKFLDEYCGADASEYLKIGRHVKEREDIEIDSATGTVTGLYMTSNYGTTFSICEDTKSSLSEQDHLEKYEMNLSNRVVSYSPSAEIQSKNMANEGISSPSGLEHGPFNRSREDGKKPFDHCKHTEVLDDDQCTDKMNELYGGQEFSFSEEGSSHYKFFITTFVVTDNIGRQLKFEGRGRSKKEAKLVLAKRLLQQVHGYKIKDMQPTQSAVYNSGIKMSEASVFADKVSDAINLKFIELCKLEERRGNYDYDQMQVIAGICMTRKPVTDQSKEQPEVISIGTGTKLIHGKHFTASGEAIFDCHAEIIARRAFKRYLFAELTQLLQGHGSSIFYIENKEITLIKSIRFHLYINTATCGDARHFVKSNGKDRYDLPDANPDRPNRGILRTKIENGEGTVPIEEDRCRQTWDGILGEAQIMTMSCSDKVMRWNVLGIQGSLLSQIIKPIYLSTISLGMLYHQEHFKRAMFQRLDNCCDIRFVESSPTFRIERPMLSPTSYQRERRAYGTPAFSVNWNSNDNNLEMIQTSTGRLHNDTCSRLAKASLFSDYIRLVRLLAEYPDCIRRDTPSLFDIERRITYLECKQVSAEYNRIKTELYKSLKQGGVGIWVKKPEEVDSFHHNS